MILLRQNCKTRKCACRQKNLKSMKDRNVENEQLVRTPRDLSNMKLLGWSLLYELSPLHLTDVTSPYWSDSVQAEGSGLEYLCVMFVHFFFLRKVRGRRKTCLVFLKSKEAARWFWFISEPWHAKREHVDNHTCSLAWLQSELVDRSHWKAKQTLQSVFKLNWRLPKVFSSAPKLNLALNKHGTLQTYSEPRTLNWERKGVGMNNKAQYVPSFKWIILGLKSGHERDVLETL